MASLLRETRQAAADSEELASDAGCFLFEPKSVVSTKILIFLSCQPFRYTKGLYTSCNPGNRAAHSAARSRVASCACVLILTWASRELPELLKLTDVCVAERSVSRVDATTSLCTKKGTQS